MRKDILSNLKIERNILNLFENLHKNPTGNIIFNDGICQAPGWFSH